ncbi:MAG: TonB-dependent receptor [Pseudomonadales bacterium]|nr:TonB-dependent receptor [Pseudomonadales bacterium]
MRNIFRYTGPLIAALALSNPVSPLYAANSNLAYSSLEEVIVTARKLEESLQDVPVTVAVLSEKDLSRYNIQNLSEVAKLIPNMQINLGGSGNGSNIFLRGVGSSSISAAFDQSVAINIDGVVTNRGRFIHNAYLDMRQLEVLKGPQSLYFGKSATAGVVSISTNDPGDEFEVKGMLAYESEHQTSYSEFVLSSPITDTLGARLALGISETDELYKSIHPGASKRYRGEESKNARLTLAWQPTDTFKARVKLSYSEYENDDPLGNTEAFCPEGSVQPTTIVKNLGIFPTFEDCKINGNTSISDALPVFAIGLPVANGGVPYLEQDTELYSLQMDWDFSQDLSLTSVSSYVDLEHQDYAIYDLNAGIIPGAHANDYESVSQELRLTSSFDGNLNFMLGLYYQDIEQAFIAHQTAVSIAALVGPDPITGRGYDYNKNHFLDSEVISIFLVGYWDITDQLELTAGVRYTDEEKKGFITIPYVHAALQESFDAPELIDNLKFEDENLSPEIALNWHFNDNISSFIAYKEGFKSGGIDNSALPSATLSPSNPSFPDFLEYDSERAKGFELGIKSRLLGGALRLNATLFTYDYKELQIQTFDSAKIQFATSNVSELRTEGAELDIAWLTPIEGLSIRGALAITDARYTDDFINQDLENLKGEDRLRSADLSGFVGATYEHSISGNWVFNLSLDTRYSDEYSLMNTLNPYMQDSFWLTDAAMRIYSIDRRYELALIGHNLGNKIIAFSSGNRPGACVEADVTNPNPALRCKADPLNIEQDQVVNTGIGRRYTLQFKVNF